MFSTAAVFSAFTFTAVCGLFLKTQSFGRPIRNSHKNSNLEGTVDRTV
jgi:hypothetical protein